MPCFTTETSDYHAFAVTAPPSMFRDLAVPHFRPVPFRTLDRSSVPFRSAPFREIVTTHNFFIPQTTKLKIILTMQVAGSFRLVDLIDASSRRPNWSPAIWQLVT